MTFTLVEFSVDSTFPSLPLHRNINQVPLGMYIYIPLLFVSNGLFFSDCPPTFLPHLLSPDFHACRFQHRLDILLLVAIQILASAP